LSDQQKRPGTPKSQGLIASAPAFSGERPELTVGPTSDGIKHVRKSVLRRGRPVRRLVRMPESAFDRDDVNGILEALFDIRALLTRLVDYFEDGDEGEEEANS
jgi:hypothetical protein